MRVAVISYHKNVFQLYPETWITDYRESIENQSYSNFDLYEVNYGESFGMIFMKSNFQSKKFETFVHCMNWMLDYLFNELNYDYVANTNVDDKYDVRWLEKSIKTIYQRKYDLVSCNFKLFNDERGVYHTHYFHVHSIREQLAKDHNIICHPGVVYSRKFWLENGPYIPEEIPFEDMKMWQRALQVGSKMFIQPEHLVFHRVHQNAVCRSTNR